MIIRLLLYLLPMALISTSEDGSDCATRVDILNGADLAGGVAKFLTEKSIVATAMHCAMDCYKKKCDVAYFFETNRECRFTPESASTINSLPCDDVIAVEHKEGVDVLDRVKRFCMSCRGFRVSGNRKHNGNDAIIEEVQLSTLEAKPIPLRILRPTTPRVRLFLPKFNNMDIPPRPKNATPQLAERKRDNKVDALTPTRLNTTLQHSPYSSFELQRVDGITEKYATAKLLPLYSIATTLRSIRTRQRYQKLSGYSFRKNLFKIAKFPSRRTRFYNEATAHTHLRFIRKKRRGWGRA